MEKILAAKVSDIPSGKIKRVKLPNSLEVAIANVDGKFFAMENKCGHMGGPLGNGKLEGNIVTCPWHGSKWDVTTGKCAWFRSPLKDRKTYPVSVTADQLFVEI